MELHALAEEDADLIRRLADEFRAELARQRKTAADFAVAIGASPHTTGRRLKGETPGFNAVEMARGARFLGLSVATFWERASASTAEAVA